MGRARRLPEPRKKFAPRPPSNRVRRAPHFSPSQARETALAKQHTDYLEEHPEAKQILADFISQALAEQPVDVFEFAQKHFKGSAFEVEEDAADEEGPGSGAAADDLDDLDDLDAMASPAKTQLTAYLKNVFESMDVDGSGTITKDELKKKLDGDTELQTLLEAAGGDGSMFVLEQLDLDGDGEITWMEFEQMLGDSGGA